MTNEKNAKINLIQLQVTGQSLSTIGNQWEIIKTILTITAQAHLFTTIVRIAVGIPVR